MADMIDGLINYPTYTPPTQDPADKARIDQRISQGDTGIANADQEANRAAQSAQGLIPTMDNVSRQNSAMGMNNSAQTQAILTKGESVFSDNMRKLMTQNQLTDYNRKSQSVGEAYNLSRSQWGILETVRQQKIQDEENYIATRNQIIGQILGGAGAVAGAVYGGPMGAAVGYQVGSGIGGGGQQKSKNRNQFGSGMQDFEDRKWTHKDYQGLEDGSQ